MIHYSCDLCGKSLGKERYEANIEITPVHDPDELTEDDLDTDHLQQIGEEISQMGSTKDFELEETGPKRMKFDFCTACAHRFAKTPLHPKMSRAVRYSEN
ncbi:hypothetical protein KOR42_29500 [Thalassoglobus neptunius]|uniref:Uncharacterized protein n=1 Tax=Thalassoglobus neptunius TaxID=1938619 RepID=A0A5C5WZH3_9PLAN|nr:hypothetical protein [Thalassoglobus neptunius]TWT55322.1 hypothetical protein KOR42_29500 [Thalassoglobus neptunius]